MIQSYELLRVWSNQQSLMLHKPWAEFYAKKQFQIIVNSLSISSTFKSITNYFMIFKKFCITYLDPSILGDHNMSYIRPW